MKAAKLEIGVGSQKEGAKRKEPEEVFLQISDAPLRSVSKSGVFTGARYQKIRNLASW
jgi:hypothetical protein